MEENNSFHRSASEEREYERREQRRIRMRERRANESAEERSRRTIANRESMRRRREQETDEKRDDRHTQNRTSMNLSRRNYSISEYERQLEANRISMRRRRRASQLKIGLSNEIPELFSIGPCSNVCDYCNAKYFEKEKPPQTLTPCCSSGKISLPINREPPELINALFTNMHPSSQEFLKNIRQYNSSLALASATANVQMTATPGVYCYRIHGQIYHATSFLYPENEAPRFSQVYILDTEQALSERNGQALQYQMDSGVLWALHQVLLQTNPYVRSYRMMKELEVTDGQNVKMYFKADPSADMRRYNPARVSEVAAIFSGVDGQAPSVERSDIVIYPRSVNTILSSRSRNNGLITIPKISPHCDPMVYPLLFPFGEQGWNCCLEHSRRTAVRNQTSLQEFYNFNLYERVGRLETKFLAQKLFQQYIVDAYVKIEGSRLDFLRFNQDKLRVELYQGLSDYIDNQAEMNGVRIGRRIILPSSFIGSPRAMQQYYQDALAIVGVYGKPDLFITFTCNPNWNEISDNRHQNTSSSYRPDLIVRVFKQKLNELMCDLTKKGVLGRVSAYVYTIEFQKRGLPHAHILLILDEEDKIRTADQINSCVRADIPDEEQEPDLHALVSTFMIHGPCGNFNENSPCMEKGKCTKEFPKKFCSETVTESNVYKICQAK